MRNLNENREDAKTTSIHKNFQGMTLLDYSISSIKPESKRLKGISICGNDII